MKGLHGGGTERRENQRKGERVGRNGGEEEVQKKRKGQEGREDRRG